MKAGIHLISFLLTNMGTFLREVQVRWSDLDPNFHLRHSIYYDWGAFCRVEYLYHIGLTAEKMKQFHIGPILFREECLFRKEIQLGDKVWIDLKVSKARRDFSRWTIVHQIFKNENVLAAILTVDIAWMDTIKRKLAVLPAEEQQGFQQMPITENFQWID
jgi:acyl-CoA thioester hydrolase